MFSAQRAFYRFLFLEAVLILSVTIKVNVDYIKGELVFSAVWRTNILLEDRVHSGGFTPLTRIYCPVDEEDPFNFPYHFYLL